MIGVLAGMGGIGNILVHGLTPENLVGTALGGFAVWYWRGVDQSRNFYDKELEAVEQALQTRKDR